MAGGAPIQMNAWKHHAGHVRAGIAAYALDGSEDASALLAVLRRVGTGLMDLYAGPLSVAEIAAHVEGFLRESAFFDERAFAGMVAARGGYRVLTLPDASRWVLRHLPGERCYVHVHPGRRSPGTTRVRANVMKTATVALFLATVSGCDVRERFTPARRLLALPPLGPRATAVARVVALLEGRSQPERAGAEG